MLGILGEYIGKLLMNSNKTPQFVIRETVTKNGRRLGDQPAGRETNEEVKGAGQPRKSWEK